MTDFDAQRAALRRQIQDLNKQERIGNARDQRAQVRATMTPEQVKAQSDKDALAARVFGTEDGQAYLALLAPLRPIVHDEIQETIARANGTSEAAVEAVQPAPKQ